MNNPFDALEKRLENIESLLLDIKHPLQIPIVKEELLDEYGACDFLKTNSVTLWRWVKAGKIKVYKFSHKNYYKRNELLETITELTK